MRRKTQRYKLATNINGELVSLKGFTTKAEARKELKFRKADHVELTIVDMQSEWTETWKGASA